MAGIRQVFSGILSHVEQAKREATRPRSSMEVEGAYNKLMKCKTSSLHSRLEAAVRARAYLLIEVKRSPGQKALIRRLLFEACRRLDLALAPRAPSFTSMRVITDGDLGAFVVYDDGSDSVKFTQLCSSKGEIRRATRELEKRI